MSFVVVIISCRASYVVQSKDMDIVNIWWSLFIRLLLFLVLPFCFSSNVKRILETVLCKHFNVIRLICNQTCGKFFDLLLYPLNLPFQSKFAERNSVSMFLLCYISVSNFWSTWIVCVRISLTSCANDELKFRRFAYFAMWNMLVVK